MVGGWRLWILFVQGILLLAIDWRGLAQGPDCWETCFEPANRNDQYKNEYKDIMDMISNIRSAAATSGGTGTGASNGTAFLMDTTVPASASSEMQKNGIGPPERDGSNIVFCYGQHYVNESTIFHKV